MCAQRARVSFPPRVCVRSRAAQTFQMCTIANTPRKPEHCVAYVIEVIWHEAFPGERVWRRGGGGGGMFHARSTAPCVRAGSWRRVGRPQAGQGLPGGHEVGVREGAGPRGGVRHRGRHLLPHHGATARWVMGWVVSTGRGATRRQPAPTRSRCRVRPPAGRDQEHHPRHRIHQRHHLRPDGAGDAEGGVVRVPHYQQLLAILWAAVRCHRDLHQRA
jgi:hypothetical protein